MKEKTRTLTAIVVDPAASSYMSREEEIADHVERFTRFVGPLDWYALDLFYDEAIRVGTDLVLFDYGGMGSCSGLLADNSRRVVRWAIDHPSALVVVVSRCTWAWAVRYEIMDAGFADPDELALVYADEATKEPAPRLPNVVYSDSGDSPIPSWWRPKATNEKEEKNARARIARRKRDRSTHGRSRRPRTSGR